MRAKLHHPSGEAMTIIEATTTAHEAIRRQCDRLGKPYPPMPRVYVNRRLTVTGGQAKYRRSWPLQHTAFLLELGKPWLAASAEGQRETVIHEAMHIVDAWVHGHSSHGGRWQSLMLHEGLQPSRLMTDTAANAAAARARFAKMRWVHCPCASHHVSARRANKLATPWGSATCRYCRGPVSTTHPAPEQVERRLQEKAA